MIEFKCNQCGADMESPDSLAGQPEECPNCGLLNRVPMPKPTIQPRHVPPQRGPASGRKPLLVGAVVAGVIVVAVGGYLSMRQGPPKAATHEATQEPGPAQNESELARLRAENAQLNAKIARAEAAQPPVPVRAAPEPPKPRLAAPPTVSPPAPKGVTVSGSAYVVRASGRSDILRGLHVTLIQGTIPGQVLDKALTATLHDYRSDAADKHKRAAEEGKALGRSPEDTYVGEEAKEADRKAQEFSKIVAKVSGPVDCATALKLLWGGPNSLNVIPDMVASIKIAATTTDVQGAYKFTDAPSNAYIFAMFVTPDAILIWAVPVQGSGSKDLFNDTALILE